MAKYLEILMLFFCIGGCIAGVVNRSFKQQQNDILGLTLEQSEMGNVGSKTSIEDDHISSKEVADPEPVVDVDVVSSVELLSNDSSGDLLNSSSTKASSELDLGNWSPPLEDLNFTGNASKDSEVLRNRQLEDLDQEKDDIKLNEGTDATFSIFSNETVSAIDHTDLLNNTANETTSNVTTGFEFIGHNSSLIAEVSNDTDRLLRNNWPPRDLNESETRIEDFRIQLNESNSNTSLPSNETESRPFMDFNLDINDTIEEMSSGFISEFDNIVSKTSNESENQSFVNASEGIFSNFGFEFLKNSEVAKNAALAMEVFNFTDASLTDHIFEDGEFHGFLDLATSGDGDALNSTSLPIVEFNSTIKSFNSSERVDGGIFEDGNNVSLTEKESSTVSATEVDEVTTDAPDLFEIRNETLEFVNFTDRIGETNETSITDILVIANDTESIENDLIESDFSNGTNVIPQCPPPGICIFWFLSRDTCAVDGHCLGSRICCKIRCSKTCIDV